MNVLTPSGRGVADVKPRRTARADTPTRLDRFDGLILVGLPLLIGLYALGYFDFSRQPMEDAAMLMRYARHLAEGYGIVWNVGDRPVDGATDFLFMVVLAALARAGLTIETAVRLVGFASHTLTVLLVYLAVRRLHGSSRWIALLSATYLALGPGLGYVQAYFGTPFFALFAALTWYLANHLADDPGSARRSLAFSLSGLAVGLIRPEGVFLAVLMLLAVLCRCGVRRSQTVLIHFLAVFVVLGGTYFLWRWSYFGYPLPNPFYKKGGGTLHWLSLKEAVSSLFVLCLPFTLAFVLAFRSARTTRQAAFVLIPVAGFTAIWVLLSNEMNYLMRFQYALLPIVLISWPGLVRGIREDWKLPSLGDFDRRSRLVLAVVAEVLFLAVLAYQYEQYAGVGSARDGRYDVARMLSAYSQRGYAMATTEAGLLPFYSRWRAVDAWGLNDQTIAHQGGITAAYLEHYRPELIVFHAYTSPIVRPGDTSFPGNVSPAEQQAWLAMVAALQAYAEQNRYVLAAAFGDSPYDTHYYYVSADCPDSAEIIGRIRGVDYSWYQSGRRSINYATLRP